jgi:hypothetical protein
MVKEGGKYIYHLAFKGWYYHNNSSSSKVRVLQYDLVVHTSSKYINKAAVHAFHFPLNVILINSKLRETSTHSSKFGTGFIVHSSPKCINLTNNGKVVSVHPFLIRNKRTHFDKMCYWRPTQREEIRNSKSVRTINCKHITERMAK